MVPCVTSLSSPPTPSIPKLTTTSKISPKTKRKQNKSRRIPPQTHPPNLHPYRKPSPTPLLTPQTPPTLTRHQALAGVLQDLRSHLHRGLPIADPSIFSSLLELCFQMRSPPHYASLLHSLIPPSLLRNSAALSSKLLRLYSSNGLLDDAHHLFDLMPHRNKTHAFPWNSLISGYADLGLFEDAMALYYQMEEDGVEPDRFTFPRVLKACAGIGSVQHGEAVHRCIVRAGFGTDVFVLNALVDMYAKCGDILKARRVFDRISDRDAVSWNSMLIGYVRHGLLVETMDTCRGMMKAGIELDSVTLSAIISKFSVVVGMEIHGWVLRRGIEQNVSVANSLIGMYSEHSQLGRARMVFDAIPDKDLVSWNAVISAHRRDYRVLAMFRRMVDCGPPPDHVTFVSLLSACANLGMVEDGRRLFSEMEKKHGVKCGVEHYGCLVNMLGRAGLVEEAYEVVSKQMPFDGGPTVWGALLYACSLQGNVDIGEVAAERLFELEPDNEHNFELMLKIYQNDGRLEEVERVKRLMKDRGLESRVL